MRHLFRFGERRHGRHGQRVGAARWNRCDHGSDICPYITRDKAKTLPFTMICVTEKVLSHIGG
jgi:hypothetical protein